jgi:hypothetical protein
MYVLVSTFPVVPAPAWTVDEQPEGSFPQHPIPDDVATRRVCPNLSRHQQLNSRYHACPQSRRRLTGRPLVRVAPPNRRPIP